MTKEEYDNQIKEIEKEAAEKKKQLAQKYAFANNKIKKGNKVTDHMGTIIVEKFQYTYGGLSSYPSCIYYGTNLNKDGSTSKREPKRHCYQSNLIGG